MLLTGGTTYGGLMPNERKDGEPDWVLDLSSGVPALSPEAQTSLRQLADIKTAEDLLPSAKHVDALIRTAVAGGATEHHIATDLRLNLQDAEALVQGRAINQLFSTG